MAFAAGHRPCGECRRAAYVAYRDAWGGNPSAREMNRVLHAERLHRGTHRRRLHEVRWRELPDGAFALVDGAPWLVRGDELIEWTAHGYATSRARPRSSSAVAITPPASLAVLRAGYELQISSPT